jgi:hypothetical protein
MTTKAPPLVRQISATQLKFALPPLKTSPSTSVVAKAVSSQLRFAGATPGGIR